MMTPMGGRAYTPEGRLVTEPGADTPDHQRPTGALVLPWGDEVQLHLHRDREYQLRYDNGVWTLLSRARQSK